MRTVRVWFGTAALVAMVCVSGAAIAAPENITEAEMALIPPYCKDAQTFGYGDAYSNTSPRAPYWVSLMGAGFWGIHHYCWALINMQRAEKHSTPEVQRKGLLESVVNDIDYSIKYAVQKSGPDFVLLPELLVKRADALARLQRNAEAQSTWENAIEAKRDYWPAYAGLARYHKDRGRADEARRVVAEGLKYAPNSRSLRELSQELNPSVPQRSAQNR